MLKENIREPYLVKNVLHVKRNNLSVLTRASDQVKTTAFFPFYMKKKITSAA